MHFFRIYRVNFAKILSTFTYESNLIETICSPCALIWLFWFPETLSYSEVLDVAAVTLSPRIPSVSVPLVVARGRVDEPIGMQNNSEINNRFHFIKIHNLRRFDFIYLDIVDLVIVFVHTVRVSCTCIVVHVLVTDSPVCWAVFVWLWFYLFRPVPIWGSSLMRPFVKIWKKATVKCRNIISLIGWGYTMVLWFSWISFFVCVRLFYFAQLIFLIAIQVIIFSCASFHKMPQT